MLRLLRKSAGTWFVRIFLLLLAALFGVGIWSDPGSLLRDRSTSAVAVVGDIAIEPTTFGREYQADASRARGLLGAAFDADPETRKTVALGTIDRMALRIQFSLEADRLGLAVGDDLVRRLIVTNPAFHDAAGTFSADVFNGRIATQGMTEAAFVDALRTDILRRQLLETAIDAVGLPKTLVERIYAIRNETRVAEYIVVPAAGRPILAGPDEAALRAYYDEHLDRYTAPEYRALTYLWVRPGTLAGEIAIGDEEVQALYDEQIDRFRTPERRTVEQILAPEQAAAEVLAKRIADGEDFQAVAASLGQAPSLTSLGTLGKADFPLTELADAVFALPEGGVSAPVGSPLGWHIFRVVGIEPEAVIPIEQAKAALHDELALEKAADAAYEIANEVEDALAAGATIEETAQDLSLATTTIAATDANGLALDGTVVDTPAPRDRFLAHAFETPEGAVATLEETPEGGFFVLEVDAVTAAEPRPFAAVRDKVHEDWNVQARDMSAADAVAEAATRLAGGETLEAVAAALGVTVRRTEPFRRAAGAPFPVAMVERLFQAREGDIETARTDNGDGHVLARLVAIAAARSASDAAGVAAVRAELERVMADDLAVQYRGVLDERFPVVVEDATIESLL